MDAVGAASSAIPTNDTQAMVRNGQASDGGINSKKSSANRVGNEEDKAEISEKAKKANAEQDS
ncbi:MAG: hypothetical protein ACI9S8_001912 [Chlamydiales bacterium]|jgi:hypothetical protein